MVAAHQNEVLLSEVFPQRQPSLLELDLPSSAGHKKDLDCTFAVLVLEKGKMPHLPQQMTFAFVAASAQQRMTA